MVKTKRGGLGKGLDSLIPEDVEITGAMKQERVSRINKIDEECILKLRDIEPNRNQPRKFFEEDSLQELADSIKLYGIIQPLIVQKKENHYEIIAGERRWRAAKMANLKEVPVIIKSFTEKEIAEISLIENIQRENLNPIEEALAYQRLQKEFNLKQDEVANRVAKSRSVITNSLRLLKLDEKLQQMLIEGLITTGHAKVLLGLESKDIRLQVAEKIIDEQLSVRETEQYIRSITKVKIEKKPLGNTELYQKIEEKIKNKIGTKVSINRKGESKGKIEIEYYSADDLERIMEIIIE